MSTSETVDTLSKERRDKEVRRVVASSYLGSLIEYYDFLLYGTAAALVFGPVFFSNLSPTAGTIAAMGTFAAGYLARPLGGIIFGHFGDRIGRKSMLMLSMIMMGVASFLIGLVPPASMIGSWAAVLLVILRVIQGIALGGEWGGAALMSLEYADPKKRGFLTSFTNAGAPSGSLLGTIVMAIASMLPEDDFMSWGWRIPFLFSAALVLIGVFIRAKINESPLFVAAVQAELDQPKPKFPLIEVLKRPRTLIIGTLACVGFFGLKATFSTFGMTVAIDGGVERSDVLFAFAVGQVVAIFAVLIAARISDKVGRRPVIACGLGVYVVASFPVFAMVGSGNAVLASLGFILVFLCHAAAFGPMAAFIAENFATSSRYTGASVVYQAASVMAGFAPMAATALYGSDANVTWSSLFLMGLCAVSLIAVWLASETKDRDLQA